MRLGYDISLSERVKELLDEGTLDQIMNQVISDLDGEWKATLPQDSATRESIYHELHALNRVNIRLKALVNNLLMAERGENDGSY
jgi:hypothetical protein